MKYFFIVQGEGMGHTTQSLALRSMLEKNGHSVADTFLGTNFSGKRNVLYRGIPHKLFFSPVFLSRSDKKGIELFRTFAYNLLLTPVYIYSILKIAYNIRASEAQTVIVFYDMVGQLGSFFAFSGKPVFAVSHHFFFSHKAFKWPGIRKTERGLLLLHNWFASLGSAKILALSFTHEENGSSKKLVVVPPLIRDEVSGSFSVSGDHIHVYSLHQGLLKPLIILAKKYEHRKFKVFLHELPDETELPPNISVFPLSEGGFMESLISCGLVICTAGFETPCEAIYLDKPLIIAPSEGHFEQFCNALDAERVGAAIVSKGFKMTNLPELKNNPANAAFVTWEKQASEIFLNCIVR